MNRQLKTNKIRRLMRKAIRRLIMGNKTALILFITFFYATSLYAEAVTLLNQSPVINTGKDATVNYGLNAEKLTLLDQGEKSLIKKLRAVSNDDEKTLQEVIQRSKNADEAAKQVFDKVLEKERKSVALAAFQNGQLAEGRVDYAKAMSQYTKAVTLEEDNTDYLLAAGKMALTMAAYSKAEYWFSRLLAIREIGEEENAELGTALHNVAGLYYKQGRYDEAEPLYKRTLKIREKQLGKEHPDVAESLNNLALLYYEKGRHDEVELLLKRALEIREKQLGKEHPDMAESLNNLALLYYEKGRHDEAELLLKRALEITEKALGKEHPDGATILHNLALLHDAQDRYDEADPLYQRCLSILHTVFPDGHPNIKAGQANYDTLKKEMAQKQTPTPSPREN
ncbi:tetratricopeptide repeat protein [Desulfobulbus sp. TB]|nr:tetratricopeptide repeat protein [Desulfobulbus sp. TB]